MKKRTRVTIGFGLVIGAATLILALRTHAPPFWAAGQKGHPVAVASPGERPLAGNVKTQPFHFVEDPRLPRPALPADTPAAAPAVVPGPHAPVVRPSEEGMLISWAARDPEGAGRWLNQNRNHPKFPEMVRGYAIQIATIDPGAARQWAAVLNGNDNRFALGGTLEQHIDAIEAMLKDADPTQTGPARELPASSLLADYAPALVRQNPDEPPVLEMRPTRPDI